jgi:hypothetical protein
MEIAVSLARKILQGKLYSLRAGKPKSRWIQIPENYYGPQYGKYCIQLLKQGKWPLQRTRTRGAILYKRLLLQTENV